MVSKYVELEVDLEEFTDEDLIDELGKRGIDVSKGLNGLLEEIWRARRTGKPYDELVDKLIYNVLGKVV